MIVILDTGITPQQKSRIIAFLQEKGFQTREVIGEESTIIGAVGQVRMDKREIELLEGVQRVVPISKPFKLVSREFKQEDTIVNVGPLKIGGNRIVVAAGPCAVESYSQILETAQQIKSSGGVILRGGAFKPRTSPYTFQGLGEEGLQYLKQAGEAVGLPVVSEIVDGSQAEMMAQYVDIFQIGARNMQNFELLKRVGSLGMPVFLKRGLSATIQEWLMSAEYLMAHGTNDIVLVERGIRTFETYTRNTLDLSAIPVVKKLSHLPVIVDPSHATGIRGKVPPMALAAIAAGAHGLIVEVHPDPEKALSDGPQSLFPEQFEKLMRDIEVLAPVVGSEISRIPLDTRRNSDSLDRTPGETWSIGFQGERGAYSEKALFTFFGEKDSEPVPYSSFRQVFEGVLKGEIDYGILPIENTLGGSIHENYDLLLQYPDVTILGEQQIRIEHNLIVHPEADWKDIKRVYSHPQGLAQCKEFLEDHPEWEKIPYYDTAGSVKYLAGSGDRSLAGIASEKAAEVYGMKILKAGIETNPQNYTRFFIISRSEHEAIVDPKAASFVFATKNTPGALVRCLNILQQHQVNMHKLESRPINGKPWSYMFYVDVDIPEDREEYKRAIKELDAEALSFRVLGEYKR